MRLMPSVLKLSLMMGTALFLGFAATAVAQEAGDRPTPPDPAKMEAVRACAQAKGVELPMPPKPPEGQRPEGKPPEGAERPKHDHPKLTEEQRKIVDACFEANGLTPPKAHKR